MRSRFSAFVKKDADFLVRFHLAPRHRLVCSRAWLHCCPGVKRSSAGTPACAAMWQGRPPHWLASSVSLCFWLEHTLQLLLEESPCAVCLSNKTDVN